MSVDNYFKYLNPQNRVLLEEYKKSTQNQMWATIIILSLTIIDNILSDENNLGNNSLPNSYPEEVVPQKRTFFQNDSKIFFNRMFPISPLCYR